jgi:uncharacterized membrane protein YphA (DoxX/SURF4 family)
MNRTAIFFLVLLRLAIGWHFFTEGVQKIQSVEVGKTTTSTPFTSAGYFREATGPAGPTMRSSIGDPDQEALALVSVEESPDESEAPHKAMPPELRRRWQKLLDDYVSHYNLSDGQRQRGEAMLDQAGDNVVLWLTSHSRDDNAPELTRKFPSGEVKRHVAPAELIEDYKKRLAEVKQITSHKLWDFSKDVEKANLREKKGEVAARRTLLMNELDKHTYALLRSLNSIVARPLDDNAALARFHLVWFDADEALKKASADWEAASRVTAPVKKARWEAAEALVQSLRAISETTKPLDPTTPDALGSEKVTPIAPKALGKTLKDQAAALEDRTQRLKGAAHGEETLKQLADSAEILASDLNEGAGKLPDAEPLSLQTKENRTLERVDFLTRWGLTVVGLCLLIGLLSRTNAWLAAGFLLMTYLAAPPWPWLPSGGPSEGNYLFVNKNVIEMLALCVLGVTASGRAFGVDTVLHWIWTSLTTKSEKK